MFEKHQQETKVNRESIETISRELGFDPKDLTGTLQMVDVWLLFTFIIPATVHQSITNPLK